ncbi:MAG TPA: tetratricopeptide repeat protein [Pirellulales bacterium]|nr:tetratricopeptide repeat protein [Pirellulales bacterium]
MKAPSVLTAALLLLAIAPRPAQAWDGGSFYGSAAAADVLSNPFTSPLEFSPAERQLFLDCADGRFHQLSLVDAALVAGGVEDLEAIGRYRQLFFAVRDDVARQEADVKNPLQQVELIHQVLHERLLRGGYNPNATNLAATFQTGVYNCASATLLFVALAAEFNIQAQAIELPGHVRAIVSCGGQRYEIEVTCPVWQEAMRPIGGSSDEAVSTASAGALAAGREISPCGLVAMIYYNRGIDAFNERGYAEAVAANRKALLLDPDNQLARGNLLAAVNNWALALCDASRFGEAEMLLAEGEQFDPTHAAFVHNALHVRQMWAQSQAAAAAAQKTGSAMPSL